ncbi:MAG: hypothetical protein CMH83_02360 [Nocardioides sp.]|nr:hypothetical protein [Nocardioides sp.]
MRPDPLVDEVVDIAVAGGDHQHLGTSLGPQPPAHLGAVEVGQVQVERDEVGVERRGQLERLDAAVGRGDVEPETLEHERDERLRVRLVLDDQHSSVARHPHPPS